MRKLKISLLFLLGVGTISVPLAKDKKKAPSFKSVKIVYESKREIMDLGGTPSTTVEETDVKYVDLANQKKRIEKTIRRTARGKTMQTQSIRIVSQEETHLLNPKRNVDFYFKNYRKGDIWIEDLPDEKEFVEEDEILGRSCRVYKKFDSTVCLWNGFILWKKYNLANVVQSGKAIEIKENIKINPELFDVPAGYEKILVREPVEDKKKKDKK